jgi:hypothetical protein
VLPLGLLVTQTGHAPVSGMTDITSVVWPGHFLCCSVTEWPPPDTEPAQARSWLPRLSVTAGDVRAQDDGLVVLQVESEKGGVSGGLAVCAR